MKLKVRELREYLHLHGVSTHLCREKVFFFNHVMYLPVNTITCFSSGLLFL